MKICILSDDGLFADGLSKTAQDYGISVCGSTGCVDIGIKIIEQSAPDCTIIDNVLSGIDSLEALRVIHSMKARTKIIMVSAVNNQNIVQKCVELGCDYYLFKPTSTETIIERVRDVCGYVEQIPEKLYAKPLGLTNNDVCETRKISIEERITNIFIAIGVPPHIRGYQYLREGIKITIENPSIINQITKKLYPSIGEKFDTSASKVERSIRHAIQSTWSRGKIENINNVFGLKIYTGGDKPTNGEFIALIADKLLLENL